MLVDDSDLSRIIYHSLAGEFHIERVIREGKVSRSTFLKRRLKKLGWRKVLGQILFVKLLTPYLRRESAKRKTAILREYGMIEASIPAELVVDVSSVNDEQTISLLQKLSPSVVVVNGTRIIEEKVLNTTSGVFLNTHVGMTPLYRGVHGGYWALAAGDPEHCGVTIHKIDRGIDTGAVVAQTMIRPTSTDNFSTYPLLQIANAIPKLKDAVHNALSGTLTTLPAWTGKSKLWSHPTAWEYLRNRIRLGVR